MLIKSLESSTEIIANDGCRLREVLHPDRDPVDLPYSLAFARVDSGQSTYPHLLKAQTEVYTILEGRGRMHIGDETRDVQAGDSVVIPPTSSQWIENTGEGVLRFTALVSPPWRAEDDVRL